jgi:predicted DNA-binding transcriptional regulator AlpA
MKQLSRTDKHTPFENKPVNGLKSDQLRFVRPKKVCRILSISHQQLWRMRQAGAFINPIQVSSKVVAFRSGELLAWMADTLTIQPMAWMKTPNHR